MSVHVFGYLKRVICEDSGPQNERPPYTYVHGAREIFLTVVVINT